MEASSTCQKAANNPILGPEDPSLHAEVRRILNERVRNHIFGGLGLFNPKLVPNLRYNWKATTRNTYNNIHIYAYFQGMRASYLARLTIQDSFGGDAKERSCNPANQPDGASHLLPQLLPVQDMLIESGCLIIVKRHVKLSDGPTKKVVAPYSCSIGS